MYPLGRRGKLILPGQMPAQEQPRILCRIWWLAMAQNRSQKRHLCLRKAASTGLIWRSG